MQQSFHGPAEAANAAFCILLAEDDSLVRVFTAEVLRGAGFTVVEAASGNEALRYFQSPVQRWICLRLGSAGVDRS